jgi:hypothetical protein
MSKLLDENSSLCTKSELDLFTVPATQVAVRRNFWSEVQLQNPCTNDGPYVFHITPDSYMLDLSKNYILFICRIVKEDGSLCKTTLAAATNTLTGDQVLPVNLLGKTFFKQIKIFLNGKLVSDSGDKYAYRAFMETDLNYGLGAKNTQLQASMYYSDDPNDQSLTNTGYRQRFDLFKNSQWVEILAPIHSDIFMQERYLLNQCDLRVEIYRNSDKFCLIDVAKANENYKLEINRMSLFIKKIEISDTIGLALESMLQKTSVKYPIRRVQITSLHITDNRRSTPLNSLFTGILPRRLLITMVEAEAVRGSYDSSPFVFKDFGIRDIKITSGNNTIPSTPYNLDFEKKICLRAYNQMFEGLGFSGDDKGNDINLKKFLNGSTYFIFELGSDGSDSSQWELVKEGTTTLELNFDKDLPKGGVECIVYAEFDSMLMMDYMRQPYTDYTV